MKKRVIVYIRVSTDDQNNGYSPEDQEERLLKYCALNDMEIINTYHEDESAKDFENRPEWQNILTYLRKNRNSVDYILFTKWDRFSRNIAEAYITIRTLKKYNVEPLAMEQPLDFTIPESKIMLAVYLASPEVDNDRRALNTFNGMRQAKKSGYWMGKALMGYKLISESSGNAVSRPIGGKKKDKTIMIPEGGKIEALIKKAFECYATGLYKIDELRKELNNEGLKVSRAQFWSILRNKSYLGKIFIPAYKDEPDMWINALHEPLVTEKNFYIVQDLLLGRKKSSPSKYVTRREELPLRGYLLCPQCGNNLTGSASKGHTGAKFFYYHCSKGCKERRNANEINEMFNSILKAINFDKKGISLLGEVMKKEFKLNSKTNKEEKEKLNSEIEKLRTRQKNAKTLMLDGELTAKEYKETKQELDESIETIIRQQGLLIESGENLTEHIDFCVSFLSNLDNLYDTADITTKQQIISSIFPEKLIFEKNNCRTAKIEEAVTLLCLNTKDFEGDKTKKHPLNGVLSCMVAPPRIELGFSV